VRAGPVCESAGCPVHAPELDAIAVRLLEVVPEDLLVFDEPLAGGALEPVGEALMKVGTDFLRKRRVSRVANEEVLEAMPRRLLPPRARGE
jgi:hypothetical protein